MGAKNERPRRWVPSVVVLAALCLLATSGALFAWDPLPAKEDPLVRMPGTQPNPEGAVNLEAPNRCLNCHAGFNPAVEPGHNWQGSMMAQAGRDFLFWSCLTVAAQDSIWAVGRPNATDICLRCHSPMGWLEGRSDPTNGAALTGADFDGVQCDFCHRSYDPFFQTTYDGTREGADWPGYWDETDASSTPSMVGAHETYLADGGEAATVRRFNGTGFFSGDLPASPGYVEAGSGQYFVSSGAEKRASFADAAARHRMLYSRFHKSKFFCATCHDVSNPVLANLPLAGTPPGDGTTVLTTEQLSASAYYHVERTFSEFMLSAYGQPGGAPGIGPFAPGTFDTSNPGGVIARCQDCHLRDVVGKACNKNGVLTRPTESVEHPRSGQPLHDMTGGNVWVSTVLASAVAGSPNYDAVNAGLLGQGTAALTLDLGQGLGIAPVALLDGAARARQQLELAAAIDHLTYDAATGQLGFRVQNQSGHKLISGFPEGRRMFVNVKLYRGGSLVYEVNPYDAAAATLKGLDYGYQPDPLGVLPAPAPLAPAEGHVDELVYEMHPKSDLTGEDHSFHFALATGRSKDNRIPPRGFRIAEAAARLSVPVWQGSDAPDYFTAAEYAGGYDEVSLAVPAGADGVEVALYYQTTSREYVEFLRDEITANPANLTLPASAYLVQSDSFFTRLRAWGDTLWALWTHNREVPGAAPYLMASVSLGAVPGGCEAPVPTLVGAVPGHQKVTLTWSDEHAADPQVVGYGVYYDQAGKAQVVAQVGLTTTYTDGGLTSGQEYCYKVTSHHAECESAFGNVVCAVPTNQGQSGVDALQTGYYTGHGSGQTFVSATTFAVGDGVVVRAHVFDVTTGQPIAGATVQLAITGPESVGLTTGSSDASGWGEVTWQTRKPRRNDPGTATGSYTATVTGVSANGYAWNGVGTSAAFTLQ